jgi:hypothetical protein
MSDLRRLTTLFATLVLVAPVQAYDGNKLIPLCSSGEQFLAGYIAGMVDKAKADMLIIISPGARKATPNVSYQLSPDVQEMITNVGGYCIPASVTVGQVVAVFCKYLADNPVERHKEGAYLFVTALKAAWPCHKQ